MTSGMAMNENTITKAWIVSVSATLFKPPTHSKIRINAMMTIVGNTASGFNPNILLNVDLIATTLKKK